MKLLTSYMASKEDGSPTRQAIDKKIKEQPPPDFVKKTGDGKYRIDVECESWIKWIEGVRSKQSLGKYTGKKKEYTQRKPKKNQVLSKSKTTPADEDEEIRQLSRQAAKAQLLEPILKNQKLEYENEMKKTELQKIAGNLIEYDVAEFLFLGYMERINLEILSLPQKIESIIHTHVMEGQTKEIVKLLKHENEKILIEIKQAQLQDVKKWKEDHRQNYKAKKR